MAVIEDAGIKNGRPILEGTKLSVFQVYQLVGEGNVTAEEMVESYPDITHPEQVHEAIEWVKEHPDRFSELRQQHDEATEQLSDLAANT